MLTVLPQKLKNECLILNRQFLNLFETGTTDALTLNGWLAFWAIFTVEAPRKALTILTYLDTQNTTSDPERWFVVRRAKSEDAVLPTNERTVIRALLLGDRECGKSTFAHQLSRPN